MKPCTQTALVVNSSALPAGAGVGIFDQTGAGGPLPAPAPGTPSRGKGSHSRVAIALPAVSAGINGPLAAGLLYSSQQCTG